MSLTQSNLNNLTGGKASNRSVNGDSVSRSSYRSLRSSQQSGYYASKQSIPNYNRELRAGITEDQKVRLQQTYQDLNAGKISKGEFVNIVKSDLKLKTNSDFDKAVGQVDFNYGEVVRGISKQYREENQNLKPNTCDPSVVTGYDVTISVGKFQEKFLPVPNFDKSNDLQKRCLEEVVQLRNGKTSTSTFLQNLQKQGLSTDLVEKELRELNASNQANYSRIQSGVFRALEEQRRYNNDATSVGLNDHPVRSDAACNVQANEQRVEFAVPSSNENKESIYLDKQLRTLSYGNVYNELKRPAPEFVLAAKDNGDIFTWAERQQTIQTEPSEVKRKDLKHNQTQIFFQDPPAKPEPVELSEKLKRKILSQTTSTRNILAYESEPIASPKKDLKMLNGNGDIISWNNRRK